MPRKKFILHILLMFFTICNDGETSEIVYFSNFIVCVWVKK